MYYIFRWRRERKNDHKTTSDLLVSQQYKKSQSRIPHVKLSLQSFLQKKRQWPSIQIERQQVIIICNFIMREKDVRLLKSQIT
jgi:hypothetical protein